MLLGVDVGGTFTDAVLATGGRLVTAKSPTTPHDQSEGVIAAVEAALERAGASASDVELFAHGMTVATNALLEGRGARTVLVATEGFTDIVELGRQARADLYRLCAARPAPLVAPSLRVPAPERMEPGGVLRALEDPAALAETVAGHEPEAVAVVLLHSYAHPEHEQAIARALAQRLPDVHVSLSHEVVGTFREYERAATTEVDAALSPLLASYLRRLLERAARDGLPEPRIMQSSGGLAAADLAARHAAFTVLSGPAGGAAAAALVARRSGRENLVCFDMGGTSCDVCVVEGGVVRETAGREVGGRPLALPMVDIHTVGAGGGSVAWRDPGGALRVGPRSAGADPGPACYGRGGEEATVTDANLLLGRLDAEGSLAGGVALDRAAARARRRRARVRARARCPRVRRGDRARRERRDGARAARDDRPAGHRPARLRAARVRRRRAAARDRDRRRARDDDDPLPARVGRAERARPRRRRPPRDRAAHGPARRRRADGRRARGGRAVRGRRGARHARRQRQPAARARATCGSTSPTTSATAARPTSSPCATSPGPISPSCAPHSRTSTTSATATATPTRPSRSSRSAPPRASRARSSTSPPATAPAARARAARVVFDGTEHDAEILRGEPAPGERVAGPAVCELPEATLAVAPGWAGTVDDAGTIVLERSSA